MENDIQQLLRELENKIPTLGQDTNPPLNREKLDQLEREFNVKFPDSLRSLFGYFNGIKTEPWTWTGLFMGFDPLSAHDAVAHSLGLLDSAARSGSDLASSQSQPDGAAQLAFFLPGYFVFAYDGSRGYLAVDHQPGPQGIPGQIITVGQVSDTRYVLANSLLDLLKKMNRMMDTGELEYSGDDGLHFPDQGNDLVYLLDHTIVSF
jgi:cell wall assembly regulator SMI1